MTKKSSKLDAFQVIINIARAIKPIISVMWCGLKKLPKRKTELFLVIMPIGIYLSIMALKMRHIDLMFRSEPGFLLAKLISFAEKLGPGLNAFIILSIYLGIALIFLGYDTFKEWSKYQKAIDSLGLKNNFGQRPKLVKITRPNSGQIKIKVDSYGVGSDLYENKKLTLESSTGHAVESIHSCKNKQFIEILFLEKELPTKTKFKDLTRNLKGAYSFVVGESVDGPVYQSIRELPHLLIAGTTGGGKSVFFKQTLMGLLETSPHLQMYLLDLKGGVEFTKFGDLENVRVATDVRESLIFLRAIRTEMRKRFKFLKEKKLEDIEPERDKKDIILLGIDEASMLYMLGKKKDENYEMNLEAREITDEIVKLGRAAGISVVFATQRVTAKTIDTNIQENVEGRVCFRMNTFQGSNLVLGNKKANDLPDIPGRALWSKGNQLIEVQAPFIDKKEIEEKLEILKAEQEKKKDEIAERLIISKEIENMHNTGMTDEVDET